MQKTKLLWVVIACLFLVGCQAGANNDNEASGLVDEFVGVFVSRDYYEVVDGNNRLYAIKQEDDAFSFAFEGIQGFELFVYTDRTDEAFPALGTCANFVFSDVKSQINLMDDGDEVEILASLYTNQGIDEMFYFYSIYQNGNDVFVDLESSEALLVSDMGVFTQRFTSEEDPRSKHVALEIRIEAIDPTTEAFVLEMDDKSQILNRTEINLNQLPETFSSTAQYIIVEEHKGDGSIAWNLFDRQAEALEVFSLTNESINKVNLVFLDWQ